LVSVLSGYTDYHETFGHERRTATAHGLLMTVANVFMVVSFVLRIVGDGDDMQTTAIVLSTIGLGIVLLGSYIGGHLTFGMGTMVNRAAFFSPPEDFVAIGAPADFPEGELRKVQADGFDVLVVRRGG